MAKYEVIKAWYGVKVGDVVEIEKLHPSIKANVRLLQGKAGELTPSVEKPKKK